MKIALQPERRIQKNSLHVDEEGKGGEVFENSLIKSSLDMECTRDGVQAKEGLIKYLQKVGQ